MGAASRSDWDRYPPPGALFDIGGYRLHLNCIGERAADQSVVGVEAGSGLASPDWVMAEAEALLQAGQRELTNLSTKRQFLVAEGSGHNIPVENPDIITAAVRGMVDQD